MALYFAQECWIPRKPKAEFLPLLVCIRHVAIFLVWSIILSTGRVAIVVMVVKCPRAKSSKVLAR